MAPSPLFPLDAQVRYRPLVTSKALAWQATEKWRVIGVQVLSMLCKPCDEISYYIQPWTLTGQWVAHDRPLHVYEGQLTPWKEESATHA